MKTKIVLLAFLGINIFAISCAREQMNRPADAVVEELKSFAYDQGLSAEDFEIRKDDSSADEITAEEFELMKQKIMDFAEYKRKEREKREKAEALYQQVQKLVMENDFEAAHKLLEDSGMLVDVAQAKKSDGS